MVKLRYITMAVASSGAIAASAVGIANAAPPSSSTTNSSNGNVGSSSIPRTTFKDDADKAAATILKTTAANVQSAHKNKTFGQLIKNAGLTKKEFAQEMKSELTSELEGQGYTQDQVTIALQHREIARLHHKLHHTAKP